MATLSWGYIWIYNNLRANVLWCVFGIVLGMTSSVFMGSAILSPLSSLSDVTSPGCDVEFEALCTEEMVTKHRSEKGGAKMRRMVTSDLPPELQDGWDPEVPESPVKRLPQALIVGYEKCGTGALVAFLPRHPDIVTVDWEVNYFCDQHYFQYPLRWYKEMMPPSYSHQVTLEKSPCYIMDRVNFERMKAYNSSLKVIIAVRDPLDLLMSKYGQMKDGYSTFGKDLKPVESVLLRKNGSLNTRFILKYAAFSTHVRDVFDIFPSQQIHVVDGDQLIQNPLVELKKLEEFLGVQSYFSPRDFYFDQSKGFYCYRHRDTGEGECLGSSKGRPHDTLEPGLNKTIRDFLRPYSEEFFQIVGKRFPWKL